MRHATTTPLLGAILCSVAIAACGSSGTSPGSAGSTRASRGIKFADCMRANGVPGFPDPSAGGFGFHIQEGSGIDPFSPSFKAARAACGKLLPGGGPGAAHPSAQAKAQMVQVSQCMRQHGISGFPDPTLSPPVNVAGYSQVIGRGGVFVAVPNTINTGSPAFRQAAAACGFGR